VPRDLETIYLECLEKNQARRYSSAQELAEDLSRLLRNEPVHAWPVSHLLNVHRWCVRNKPLAIAGAAILALLLVVATSLSLAAVRFNRKRKQAFLTAHGS